MSRTFLVFRLAARDLRWRRAEAALMLLAIAAVGTVGALAGLEG